MIVDRKITVNVCDICRNQFGGKVYIFGDSGEICSKCWTEPTEDMKRFAVQIMEGCYQCRSSLREFLSGFAVLYSGSNSSGIAIAKNLDEAKEVAIELTTQDSSLVDIFDHGKRMNATVVMDVLFTRLCEKLEDPPKEMPKEIEHVYARDGAWWFWDETYDQQGPYKTRECAEKALKVYTDTVLGPPPSSTKASEKQPPPTGNGLTILPLVLSDIQERAQAGLKKYGTLLRAYNGRDALWDAYQEAIDLVMYLRQDIEERNQVLQNIDWNLLSKQKLAVVEYLLSSGKDGGPSIPAKLDDALNGLVNFLDNLQDQGEKAGLWIPETEEKEAE